MTNPPSDFLKYIGTPLQKLVLPIIPAGDPLREDSSLTADHLGKIPGKFAPALGNWTGYHNWQYNISTPAMLQRWQEWQRTTSAIAIGVRLGELLAVDIDCDDQAIADGSAVG